MSSSIPSRLLRLAAFAMASALQADTFSYSGNFTKDDDQRLITFQTSRAGAVSIRTLSYSAGGFDPNVSLFEDSGPQALIGSNDDAAPGTLDSFLRLILPAGNYVLALTQSGNLALGPNLSDGFFQDGNGNYTGGPFVDVFGNTRTGSWNVEIVTPSASPVPEPGAWAAFGLSAAAFWTASRIRRRIS